MSGFFCVDLSSLVLCPEIFGCLGLHRHSAQYSLISFDWILAPYTVAWAFSQSSNCGSHLVYLVFFSFPQGSLFFLLCHVQYREDGYFMYYFFFWIFVCLCPVVRKRKPNPVLVASHQKSVYIVFFYVISSHNEFAGSVDKCTFHFHIY